MKKAVSILLAAMILCALAACGGSSSSAGSSADTQPEAAAPEAEQPEAEPAPQEPAEPQPAEEAAWECTYQNARTYSNVIGTTCVQSIVEITNTGSKNLYLNSGAYDLEDADGNLVAARTMVSEFPSVLAPGEKGYMYEAMTLDDYSGDGELTILPRPDVQEATVDLVRFAVSDISVSDETQGTYSGIKVTGHIENTTAEMAGGMIFIVAFFYDANGVPVGSASNILTEELAAGEKIGFELNGFTMPDDVTADTVADTVVYAYPYQYQV